MPPALEITLPLKIMLLARLAVKALSAMLPLALMLPLIVIGLCVVIDTPPAQGFVTMNALYAATGLLIPLTPAMMDFASAALFFRMLTSNLEVINEFEGTQKVFSFVRLLLSKYESNNKVHQQIERWVRKGFPGAVVAKNLALSAALRTGPDMQTAYESFVGDRRTLARAMEFLDDVNEEIEALVREHWVAEARAVEESAEAGA